LHTSSAPTQRSDDRGATRHRERLLVTVRKNVALTVTLGRLNRRRRVLVGLCTGTGAGTGAGGAGATPDGGGTGAGVRAGADTTGNTIGYADDTAAWALIILTAVMHLMASLLTRWRCEPPGGLRDIRCCCKHKARKEISAGAMDTY
jgi:hypothetical protein